jgi:hypothetical protein
METSGGNGIIGKKKSKRRGKNVGMLKVQPLAIRYVLHSPSSSKCEGGKTHNEKM